jgi:hypothetical protein
MWEKNRPIRFRRCGDDACGGSGAGRGGKDKWSSIEYVDVGSGE